jgi:hypothetical protein
VGRGRLGQVLVTVGVVLVLVSLLAVGVSRELRDTESVRGAAPEILEVTSVRTAVTDELGRAIEDLYAPRRIDAGTLAVATERIVSNGYVVDDFQRALDLAHRGWLYGAPMVVELDAAVVTQASVTGLRDADVALAEAFPPGGIVHPAPILLPVHQSASWLVDVGVFGLIGALGGLVLVGFGAVADPARQRTLKTLARGLCTGGVMLILGALVLPLAALRDAHEVVAVLGALAGQRVAPLLVLAAALLFVGLSLHASADRLVSGVTRQIERARAPRDAKPVQSGAKVSRRGAGRRRSEAIDAFFGDPSTEPIRGEAARDEPWTDDGELVPTAVAEADGEPVPLTPEEERTAALASERRESLERIDGTRGGYRTHLKR